VRYLKHWKKTISIVQYSTQQSYQLKIEGGIKIFHKKTEIKTIYDHQTTTTEYSKRNPTHRR
jgi:hypothetical protein